MMGPMRLIVTAILGVVLLSYGYDKYVLPRLERAEEVLDPNVVVAQVWEDVG